jgi:hypothetical protein
MARTTLVLILAGLLAGIFTAAAEANDHVWRVWCDGMPRALIEDTSKECWKDATTGLRNAREGCRNPDLRQVAERTGVLQSGGCARIEATHNCACRPERVE